VPCVAYSEVQDVFDLFDFWDGRDSMVDGVKVGDFLRCCGLNPTQALVLANGGTANVGTCTGNIVRNSCSPTNPLSLKKLLIVCYSCASPTSSLIFVSHILICLFPTCHSSELASFSTILTINHFFILSFSCNLTTFSFSRIPVKHLTLFEELTSRVSCLFTLNPETKT